jgi:hypothetical protein
MSKGFIGTGLGESAGHGLPQTAVHGNKLHNSYHSPGWRCSRELACASMQHVGLCTNALILNNLEPPKPKRHYKNMTFYDTKSILHYPEYLVPGLELHEEHQGLKCIIQPRRILIRHLPKIKEPILRNEIIITKKVNHTISTKQRRARGGDT